MPGSRKGFKKLNARQSENFLEFLKIPFSNRLKVSDPTFFTVILIRMVGLWLRWKPCAGTRHVHSQNHSHSWRQRAERSERNGEVKGEFSWLKSVFFEAIKLWEQKDQLLRKSSQIKLLKMVLESKEINKQLVIGQCSCTVSVADRCMLFFFEIRLRLNFAESPIFNSCGHTTDFLPR